MDNKITLSFNADIIQKAKAYAEQHNISLSRLVEYLLRKTTSKNYNSLEDLPIADWVLEVAEGETDYQTKKKTRKALKDEFFASRK